MTDLGHRVESHVELAVHELGRRILVILNAVVSVAAVLGLIYFAFQGIADDGGRHVVVLANAEVEELSLRVLGEGFPLGSLDLLELVDLGALAVIRPADAVGE